MTATTTPVLAVHPAALSLPAVTGIAPLPAAEIAADAVPPAMPMAVHAEPATASAHEAPGAVRRHRGRSPLATSALVVSLLGLLILPLPMGVLGLALGGLALARNKANENGDGEGMAVAALVIGMINVGFWAVWMLSQIDDRIPS